MISIMARNVLSSWETTRFSRRTFSLLLFIHLWNQTIYHSNHKSCLVQ